MRGEWAHEEVGGHRDLVIRDVRGSPCDLNDAEQMENCITNEKRKNSQLGLLQIFFWFEQNKIQIFIFFE